MDTIQQAIADTMDTVAEQAAHNGINVWLIIALVVFVIIIVLIGLLIGRNKGNNSKSDLKRKKLVKRKILAEGDVDLGNTMNSMFNAESLYKKLIVQCHPDRFEPDKVKVAIANELSMQITKNRHNVKRLEVLRQEAKSKLNINI